MKLIKCEGCEKKIKVYFGRRRRFCSRKCLVMIQKRMSHCIKNNGVNIHVGTFYSLSEAILARKLAEKKYFGMVVRR